MRKSVGYAQTILLKNPTHYRQTATELAAVKRRINVTSFGMSLFV
jgi:hypothetical protein